MPEIVVVGGGIIGASAAYNAARLGAEVTLVEKAADGTATEAAAGLITAMVRNETTPEWREYAYPAMRYYHTLTQELEALDEHDHGFRRSGDMTVAIDDETAARLPDALETRKGYLGLYGSQGVGCAELVEEDEIRRRWPYLENVKRAIWHDEVGVVDGRRMRRSLISGVEKLGGRVVHGWGVLEAAHGRITGVRVNGQRLAADAVIVAGGAWTANLLEPLGIEYKTSGQRGQITHVRLESLGPVPAMGGVNKHYILSFPDGRIAFGATREDVPGERFDYRTTVEGIQENFREAERLIPRIREAEYIETRIGFRPSPYRTTTIGETQAIHGLYVGLDLMQGMTLGPFTGRTLSKLATGADEPLLPEVWKPRI